MPDVRDGEPIAKCRGITLSWASLTIREAKRLHCSLIYGLSDEAGIFYVGQTRHPKSRFAQHAAGGTKNRALKKRVKSAGKSLRVEVLRVNPHDMNAAERAEIRKRAGLLNIVGADDERWAMVGDTPPWSAGVGIRSPSSWALMRTPEEWKPYIYRCLAQKSDAERCALEINLLQTFHPLLAQRFDRWWKITLPKMLSCMEDDIYGTI